MNINALDLYSAIQPLLLHTHIGGGNTHVYIHNIHILLTYGV